MGMFGSGCDFWEMIFNLYLMGFSGCFINQYKE